MRRPVRASLVSRIASGILPAAALPSLVYLGAPWWAIVVVALGATVAAVLVRVVDRVLPYDSHDLRGWWDDLWRCWAPRGDRSRPPLPAGRARPARSRDDRYPGR